MSQKLICPTPLSQNLWDTKKLEYTRIFVGLSHVPEVGGNTSPDFRRSVGADSQRENRIPHSHTLTHSNLSLTISTHLSAIKDSHANNSSKHYLRRRRSPGSVRILQPTRFMEEVSMSMINKEISDFRTYAFHENDFKFVSKEDILGKWSVFFFYPADFTFVCPTELEDLADKYEQFRAIGCEVYSVSTDTHFVHKAWHDASDRIKKINYPMLADPTHSISKDFEVLIPADGLAERGTFIINPEGKIVGYEVTAGNVGRNAEELLRKVQACQFVHAHGDQVCPANWKPGAETLKPSLDLVGQL